MKKVSRSHNVPDTPPGGVDRTRLQLAAIVEESHDAIIGQTLDGVITSWNGGATKMFGYSAQEAVGKPILFIVPLEIQEEVPRLLDKARGGEVVADHDSMRLCKDGSRIDVAISISPVRSEDGAVIGASVVERAITKRKKAEQSLQQLAAIVEESHEAIISKTFDGIITSWNGGATKMFGYTAEEMVGKPLTRLFLPELQDVLPRLIEKVKKGEAVADYDSVWLRKDGTRADVEFSISPIYTMMGTISGIAMSGRDITQRVLDRAAIVARDITRRKELIDAVKTSEAKYRSLVESATDQIFMVDDEYRVLSINRAAANYLNKSVGELIGKPLIDFFPKETAVRLTQNFDLVFKTGQAAAGLEEKVVFFGDQEVFFSTSFSPIRDEKGAVTAVMGVVRDITERRALEEKAWASSVNFKALFEGNRDALFVADAVTRMLIDCNPSAERLLGRSRGEILSMRAGDLHPKDRVKDTMEAFERQSRGEVLLVDSEIVTRSGQRIPVEISSAPLQIDGQKSIIGNFRDITERKAAAAALAASEKKYRAFVENSPDVTYELDASGTVTFASQQCRRYGFDPDVLTGKPFINLVHTDDRPASAADFQQAMLTGIVQPAQFRIVLPDGRTGWFEAVGRCLKDEAGRPTGQTGVLRDITERKAATAALAASEEKYRQLFESSQDAFMLLTADKFIDCNQATLNMFGFATREEFLGKHPGDVSPPRQADGRGSREAADKMIAKAFKDGGNLFDWIHHRADGTDFEAEVQLSPMKFVGRDVLQATVRDMTERKKAQRAEAVRKLKDDFLFRTIHDLRSPSSIIKTVIASLGEAGPLKDPAISKNIDFIRIANAHILQLIEDLLKIGQETDPQFQLECKPLALKVVMDAVLAEMSPMAAAKRVSIVRDDSPEPPEIKANQDAFKEILVNLIQNAIKYNKKGGQVTIGYEAVDRTARIHIQDTGRGIPEEYRTKLFQPYYRGEAGRDIEGSGLGLYIVKNLVEKMGGSVEMNSVVGEGSRFTVILPLA